MNLSFQLRSGIKTINAFSINRVADLVSVSFFIFFRFVGETQICRWYADAYGNHYFGYIDSDTLFLVDDNCYRRINIVVGGEHAYNWTDVVKEWREVIEDGQRRFERIDWDGNLVRNYDLPCMEELPNGFSIESEEYNEEVEYANLD